MSGCYTPLGGLHAEDLGEVGACLRDYGASTNLRHHFLRCRHVRVRHRLLPESKEFEEELQCRIDTKISFAKCNEAGKSHDGVCCKMVGLELEVLEELGSKVGQGQAEATLEVSEEDDALAGLHDVLEFLFGRPADGPVLDAAALIQPNDVGCVDLGAVPVGTATGAFSLSLHLFVILDQNDLVVVHLRGGGGR